MGFAKSFKFKLLFSYVFIAAVSFSLAAFFLDNRLEENSLLEIKHSLANQLKLIESQLPAGSLTQANMAVLGRLAKELSAKINYRITIIDNSANTLADSDKSPQEIPAMENHSGWPEIKSALAGLTGEDARYSSTLGMKMFYIALPVMEKGAVAGVVRLAMPLDNLTKILSAIRKAVALNIFLALGLAFLLGSFLSFGIIKQINKIVYVSRKFSAGDFKHRIYCDSRDEIGELADTLNNMAQSLQDKINEIELQNQHLRTIFQSMIEGIVVIDKDERIVSVNLPVKKIFNIENQELTGKPILEVIRNNDLAQVARAALDRGELVSRELSLVWPVQKFFQINAAPIFEKGAVSGCLLVIHDVTEIRRLENMRRDFVANVSHELKTPLTSIKGFVETLLEGALEDKQNSRGFLKIVQEHADRLDNLISDLLNLSYLESAAAAALEKTEINLKAMADKIIAGFGSQVKDKKIALKNEIAPALSVNADSQKIEQVLTNLIDNAIKFNRPGGTVRIYSQDLAQQIKVTVEDSGAGIPQKDIPRIFERFYRVDKARSRQLGGTGLGLSIVKHIVELHSGRAGVESVEGLGSKFWFILPK